MNHTDLRILVELVFAGVQKYTEDGYMDEGYKKQVDRAIKRCTDVLKEELRFQPYRNDKIK